MDPQVERLQRLLSGREELSARVQALNVQAQQQEAREARPDGGQHQAKVIKRRRNPSS